MSLKRNTGCHIEINAPPDNHEDYLNRKQQYSVNLQAIVNRNLNLSMLASGILVAYMIARVLRLSGLFDLGQKMNRF